MTDPIEVDEMFGQDATGVDHLKIRRCTYLTPKNLDDHPASARLVELADALRIVADQRARDRPSFSCCDSELVDFGFRRPESVQRVDPCCVPKKRHHAAQRVLRLTSGESF